MNNNKLDSLKDIIKEMESVIIAYSGGIDSTFLTQIAYDVLKEKALAVTAKSETYAESELEKAIDLAKHIGIEHLIIETEEYKNPEFKKNPINRCYFCKKELFCKLKELSDKKNIKYVLDGSNADDTNDYRPGMLASKELNIRQPLIEVGFSKEEIRKYAKEFNLSNWNKPSSPCLSSRIPYGEEITTEKIKMIYDSEKYLNDLNIFNNIRVRYHQDIARIEVEEEHFPDLIKFSKSIVNNITKIGFKYVTLDLKGFRSGSLNEIISK